MKYEDTKIYKIIKNDTVRYIYGRRSPATAQQLENRYIPGTLPDDNLLMTIARKLAGDFRLWYVPADLNRDLNLHPLDIDRTKRYKIPEPEGFDLA